MNRVYVLLILVLLGNSCWAIEIEILDLHIFLNYKTFLLSQPIEWENNRLALGRSFTTSEPIYELSNGLRVLGTLLLTCVTTHPDDSESSYAYVSQHFTNYSDNHERKLNSSDASLIGHGAFECLATYSLARGMLTAVGIWESRRTDKPVSEWVISGGTGYYRNSRGTISVRYTAPQWCESEGTREACQIRMRALLKYPQGKPVEDYPTASSIKPLVFYEYVGSVEKTIETSVTDSTMRTGHREYSGNPIYSQYPNPPRYAPSGYVSSVCYESILDAGDSDYFIVAATRAREFRARPEVNKTGCGVSQCHLTVNTYEGTLTLQGWKEKRFDKTSFLAVTGGTGIFNHSKGFLKRTHVNASACQVSTTISNISSCIAKLELYLEKNTNATANSECFDIIDARGANLKTSTIAMRSSVFGLGELMVVGSPLYDINNTSLRIGYSAGYYHKTYLDNLIDKEAFAARWDVLPGVHTRALMWGGRGLHEGLVTLYLADRSSLVLAGSFEETLSFPNNHTIVGGTGRYAGVTGLVSSILVSDDEGSLCSTMGYQNETASPNVCEYLFNVCIVYDV